MNDLARWDDRDGPPPDDRCAAPLTIPTVAGFAAGLTIGAVALWRLITWFFN